MDDIEMEAVSYQREFFDRLAEFFERATGSSAQEFATFHTFDEAIRTHASELSQRALSAYPWLMDELAGFYNSEGRKGLALAREIGGFKLTLGGSSRFEDSHFGAVRGTLLYADTVLIPDPVLPFIESERSEERYRNVILLKTIFCLLHLKPLVDIDTPSPSIFVFPSWEKSLEENDEKTQEGILQLLTNLIAYYVEPDVTSFDDVIVLADENPEYFLGKVDENRLIISPGGALDEPLHNALEQYDETLSTWRTKEWFDRYRMLPSHRRVLNCISERVAPQYHLLENSEELSANPLLSIEQQAHYFRLISQINSTRLMELGLLEPKRQALISGLGNERLRWLSQVPMDELVQLRVNNENFDFRRKIESIVREMHDSELRDSNRVAADVAHELNVAIDEHNREVKNIQDKYSLIHGKTAIGAWAAYGSLLIPSLAPYLAAAAPLALGAKYVWDKIDERREINQMSKSLMGVLAYTKSTLK